LDLRGSLNLTLKFIIAKASRLSIKNFVEIAEMSILDFIVFIVHCMKGNMIRESIY